MGELISDREMHYHDLIIDNDNIKRDILNILEIKSDLSRIRFVHEDKYINGIYADFTIVHDNHISAIIEVKAADIGVTDYIRGIGQIFQYEYFFENNISPKGWTYNSKYKSILFIPSKVIRQNQFNIAKFKYPETLMLLEYNEISGVTRRVSTDELKKLSTVDESSLTSISQYYVRDTRLFEIYMLLRYLCILKLKGNMKANRREVEEVMKQTNSINNNNWRNAWISLSSLGLINSSNLPTDAGITIGYQNIEEFLYLIYYSYIKPYCETILEYFLLNKQNLNKNIKQINNDLKLHFKNRDVLFLTQSQGRYLSSWLNILRDDYGCLDFKSRSNQRKIVYNPEDLNKDSFINSIKQHTKANKYILNLEKIL